MLAGWAIACTRAPLFFELKWKPFFWLHPLFRAAERHLTWKGHPCTRKTHAAASTWCSRPEPLHVTRALLFFELKRKAFFWLHPLFRAAKRHLSWKGQPCTRKTRPAASVWWWTQLELSFCCLRLIHKTKPIRTSIGHMVVMYCCYTQGLIPPFRQAQYTHCNTLRPRATTGTNRTRAAPSHGRIAFHAFSVK